MKFLFAAVALTVSQNEGAAPLQDQRDALEWRTRSSHVSFPPRRPLVKHDRVFGVVS